MLTPSPLFALLLALQSMSSQVTPSPKLPPANPLPIGGAEEEAVLAPVNALLGAIRSGSAEAANAVLRADGSATAAVERPDGSRSVRRMTWTQFTAGLKPGSGAYETISDPAVEIDGDIAMVWAPFTFRLNGQVQHCGVNHFDLVREGGAWKVLNVTWSQRTTGCAG
ncbi:hypothetical protein [Sphingomonas aracearum]|uniref:DUF4440 domain-containing protein n=1 Tax=Sphingomonas aracearum TaxID=2283317 RepID=A0A369VX30_9SPHN|nr:hypothetical protein [Sphingomonas aracearum]RDE05720.1 hypothetical protein DVW87_10960 [Sphingomonas aracearum]